VVKANCFNVATTSRQPYDLQKEKLSLFMNSGRKITDSLGNVTERGKKEGKSKGERDCQQSV
jgi:hypothetical protein